MRHDLKTVLQVMGGVSRLCRYLDCLAEIVSTALLRTRLDRGLRSKIGPHFFFYNFLVNLSCGNIMVPGQSYIHIAFVVSEIEVDFPTVIEDINLT